MKISTTLAAFLCAAASAALAITTSVAEEASNLPPDPFPDLAVIPEAPPYPIELDRTRGSFLVTADEGQYVAGSHFGNWSWTMRAERWGHYYVGLVYDSSRPKMGVQVRIGTDNILKGYAPRTNSLQAGPPMVLGTAYLSEAGEHPISMLTADQSNVPAFQIRGIHFQPAPESVPLGQSIDGTIELLASHAATYAETMRYEPAEEKNCLGFWTDADDWAEWVFSVSTPGEFKLELHYGCGPGNEGSEVLVLVNDQMREFVVDDTGGFQEWKALELDPVTIATPGENRIAVAPRTLANKAVMDLSKLVLTPLP